MKTSIQYHMTNKKLFDDVYLEPKKFFNDLNKGPDFMKERLLEEWNELKNTLSKVPDLEIVDLDKEVTIADFDIGYAEAGENTQIFFFTFPEFDFGDASSRYIALVIGEGLPRYFTLEQSENYLDDETHYVIGEWKVMDEFGNVQITHVNHGFVENNNLETFMSNILLRFDDHMTKSDFEEMMKQTEEEIKEEEEEAKEEKKQPKKETTEEDIWAW